MEKSNKEFIQKNIMLLLNHSAADNES